MALIKYVKLMKTCIFPSNYVYVYVLNSGTPLPKLNLQNSDNSLKAKVIVFS